MITDEEWRKEMQRVINYYIDNNLITTNQLENVWRIAAAFLDINQKKESV